jgi:hypothetical protein
MAGENERPGRLIAIDGSRGKDVAAAAEALAAALRKRDVPCGISRWDASGLFADLIAADRSPSALRSVSARTITLVYAADLVFRLRWEIAPVLASGGVVIAAPYTATAVAVGVAAGLTDHWVREILRFAPPPAITTLARERKVDRGWPKRPARGYAEFSATLLGAAPAGLRRRRARKAAMAWLAEHAGKDATELSKRAIAELAKAASSRFKVQGSKSAADDSLEL